jgi:hypothetical protein
MTMAIGVGLEITRYFAAVSVGQDVMPVNIDAPNISGSGVVGQELSCSQGTWTGNPTPSFTYQWRKGGVNIAGATSHTYRILASDVGSIFTCVVTATNTMGSTPATSGGFDVAGTVGAELVVNGTFTDGQNDWEWPTGSGSVDTNGGVLGISASNTCLIQQEVPTIPGERYIFSVQVVSVAGTGYKGILKADNSPPSTNVRELRNGQTEGAGTSIGEFVARASISFIVIEVAGGNSMSVDNISVKQRIMPQATPIGSV